MQEVGKDGRQQGQALPACRCSDCLAGALLSILQGGKLRPRGVMRSLGGHAEPSPLCLGTLAERGTGFSLCLRHTPPRPQDRKTVARSAQPEARGGARPNHR